ncbi:LysR family transcriptional regulator [Microbulbifer sp. PSTR4-B]|uniref:LysR family transcriptional regulator n=1 Tax=Microbulbifer sp. PSTR4-B TaxID=3243396 RepID=UPI00403A2315
MHKGSIEWTDIQFFIAVARSHSARSVAEDLGVSHSTVSRRIDALEERLQARLFYRNSKGYQLTEDGEAMLGYAKSAEQYLDAAQKHLQGGSHRLSGEIRVTMPDVVASHLVIPHLNEFTNAYPQINVQLLVTSQVLSLEKHEADVALRILPKDAEVPERFIARKLTNLPSCCYGSPAYIAESLPEHGRWLGWSSEDGKVNWAQNTPYPDLPYQHQISHGLIQLEAVRSGLGLARLPCFLADGINGVIRLPGAEPSSLHDLWLVSTPEHRNVLRFKVFREFIVSLFRRLEDKLEGKLAG